MSYHYKNVSFFIFYIHKFYNSKVFKQILNMFNILINVDYLISMMTTRRKPAILPWYRLDSCWGMIKTVSFFFTDFMI